VQNTFLNNGDPNSPYQQMVRFALTDPQPTYLFKAVSQGSQCAVPVAQPSVTFAQQNNRFALINVGIALYASQYWLETELKALPNTGSERIEYFKFTKENSFAGFSLGTTVLGEYSRYNPSNFTQWDVVPGGTQSINGRTNGALSTGPQYVPLTSSFLANLNLFFFGISAQAGGSLQILQDKFSFVSTTSALDATPNISPYSTFNFAQNGNANTATNRYISQERLGATTLYNQNHTDYTARNAIWIFNEMEHPLTPLPFGCNDFCIADISGPVSFCTTATYSFALPAGAIVAWQVNNITPTGSVTFQINPNNTITLTRVNNGSATLVANITNSACFAGSTASFQKNIIFGGGYDGYYTTSLSSTPIPILQGGSSHYIYTSRGQNVTINLQLTNLTNISNLRWLANNYGSYGSGSSFTLTGTSSVYCYGSSNVSALLTGNSLCGDINSIYSFGLFTLYCRGTNNADSINTETFTATPNPVQNILNIKITKPINGKIVQTSSYYLISISELNTLLPLKQLRVNKTGGDIQINMTGLKSGYYAVEINDGNNKQILKIFKL
jgi:hypothetical protein